MIILSSMLVLSVAINIFFVLYVRWLLKKLAFLSENIGDMMASITTFSSHLEAVHGLETYYGDTTLGNLITHSKQIVKEVEVYKDIYTLFSDENDEELEKLFEREGFYVTEQAENETQEEE